MSIINWDDYAPEFIKSEFDCKETGENNMQPEFMGEQVAVSDNPASIVWS